MIIAKCPDNRRWKLSKLTKKPGKSKRVFFKEIDKVTTTVCRYQRDAERKKTKAKKTESV
jgi:hypothetical protein